MTTISLRIKELIELKKMNISSFEKKIGVGNNSIGTIINRNSNVSGIILSKILITFEDVNIDYLLTGKGEILKQTPSKEYATNETVMKVEEPGPQNEVVLAQKKTIAILEETIEDLRSDKVFLKNVINEKLGKDEVIT